MSLAASYSIAAIFSAKDKLSPAIAMIEKRYGKFAGNVGRTLGSLNRGLNKVLKVGATAALAATIAFTAMATKEFIELDNAVTQAGAKFKDLDTTAASYAASLDAIEKKSREVAGVTEFMASDAAGALDKMAMAGLDSDVSMSLLMGTTNLATAAGTDLTRAVDIATDSMGAFGLSMDTAAEAEANLNRISDVFAKTTTTANTDLNMLFESVTAGAAAFTTAGQEMETFAAFTGVLANAGLKGGAAGTSLRNVMLRLAKPTGEAADVLKNLGVQTQDSAGDFRDVIDILADFEKGLEGMGSAQKTAALATVFGARTVTGINLLLKEGSDSLREYRGELINSAGASQQMADAMRGSLSNQLAILKSSAMELGLQFVESFEKDGRGALEGLIKAVQNFDMTPITDAVTGGLESLKKLNSFVQTIGGWGLLAKIILGFAIAIKVATAALLIMNFVAAASPTTWIILGIVAAIAALTAVVVIIIKHWETISGWIKKNTDNMLIMLPVIASLAAGIWIAVLAFQAFGAAGLTAAAPILGIVAAVGLLVAGLISVVTQWDKIKKAFSEEGIGAGLLAIGKAFIEGLVKPFTLLIDLAKKIPGLSNLFDGEGQERRQDRRQSREERQEGRRQSRDERRAETQRERLELAPNAAEEESKQEQILRGEGTITVRAEDGSTAKVDNGTMADTGWDMTELGKDGVAS